MTADPVSPHQPCRGRRPRRPAVGLLPALSRSSNPRPDAGMTADPVSPHQPCRGRRPRRPFPSSTAGPTASQGLRAAGAARKGGTPGEGPPFTPSCALWSTREFRALRRAAMGSAPGPRPLFCKKAGQKTFTWRDFRKPKPLAPGASDSIRPRSGHLSGRVAPPTRVGEAGGPRNLTGAPPPQAFFFGAPPRFFGQDQRNGVEHAAQGKDNQQQTGEFLPPQKPRRTWNPAPTGVSYLAAKTYRPPRRRPQYLRAGLICGSIVLPCTRGRSGRLSCSPRGCCRPPQRADRRVQPRADARVHRPEGPSRL